MPLAAIIFCNFTIDAHGKIGSTHPRELKSRYAALSQELVNKELVYL